MEHDAISQLVLGIIVSLVVILDIIVTFVRILCSDLCSDESIWQKFTATTDIMRDRFPPECKRMNISRSRNGGLCPNIFRKEDKVTDHCYTQAEQREDRCFPSQFPHSFFSFSGLEGYRGRSAYVYAVSFLRCFCV